MRRNLGETASQAGSLNAPGRLRFDFKTPAAVPPSVLGDIEDEINEQLLRDLEVRWFITDQEEARRIGAIAMFGEKYGDRVRVVEMGDYSVELCGGTHVERSSMIGLVKLLGEASIGSGVRRVDALVGLDAFRYLAREHVLVQQLAGEFKAQPEELPERIAGVLERLKVADRELEKLHAANVLADAPRIAAAASQIGNVTLVRTQVAGGVGPNDLRALTLDVRGRLPQNEPAVVALASPAADGGRRRVRDRGEPGRAAGGTLGGGPGEGVCARPRGSGWWQGRPRPGGRRRCRAASMPRSPRSKRASAPAEVARDGVWLGVDVGTVRVGVAKSDARGSLASPLITLRRQARTDADLDELAVLVAEHDVVGRGHRIAPNHGAIARVRP